MRRDLPKNLYERGGYFSYRNPETGRELGIGYDRAQAIAEAQEANRHFERKAAGTLVSRLAGDTRTLAAFAPRYREILEARKIAPFTRYSALRYLKIVEHELGDVPIAPRQEDAAEITRRCADWLRSIEKTGKRRTAHALRDMLSDFFAAAAAAGWISVNPVDVIRLEVINVKRARLTLDDFRKIYEAAASMDRWVQRSLELGLVTLQRREDLAGMGFRDIQDGRLLVEQSKSLDSETGELQMRLRIPTSIRLQAVGWSLEEVIGRCRDDVLSRHLVHHIGHRGRAAPGDPVRPETITEAFATARDRAGVVPPAGKTPTTLHELRSLGIRLYKLQGYDAQALAGHKDPDTTRIYTDNRGAEWVDVAA